MPTFFGQQTQTSTDTLNSAGILYFTAVSFTCPGSGSQNIQELSVFCHANGTNAQVRLGIYNSTGTTLIAEGTSAVALTGSSLAWQGHMSQAAVKAAGGASPGVLVGGTNYILAAAFSTANGNGVLGMTTGGTSDNYKLQDSSGGMPASLPSPDGAAGYRSAIRASVDPAAAPADLMGQICM